MQLIQYKLLLIALTFVSVGTISAQSERLSVGVQPLSKLLINAKKSAPASIISLNNALISAEITGQVKVIHAEAGDYVKKGSRLLNLDCRTYELAKKKALAAVKVAKTQLNFSSKQFKRDNRLVSQGTISRQLFERTEANQLTSAADLELSKASVESANLAISRCEINAPFSGQITKRFAQQGQLLIPGTALFEIMQNNNFEIKTELSPNDVVHIQNSSGLKFIADKVTITTTVRSVIALIDENTNTQEVRFSLPKDTNVPAGLTGRVEWTKKNKQLPAEYVVRRNNQLGILIANDIVEGIGKAKFYQLKHAKEGQAVELRLPNETLVITKNRFRIKDRQKIKIAP